MNIPTFAQVLEPLQSLWQASTSGLKDMQISPDAVRNKQQSDDGYMYNNIENWNSPSMPHPLDKLYIVRALAEL